MAAMAMAAAWPSEAPEPMASSAERALGGGGGFVAGPQARTSGRPRAARTFAPAMAAFGMLDIERSLHGEVPPALCTRRAAAGRGDLPGAAGRVRFVAQRVV